MKDSYYFKHDYNARNDPKIVALRRKFNGLGIAVYWVLTEILHETDNHHLQDKEYMFETVSEQSGVDLLTVKSIIDFSTKELELLKVDDLGIYSERVNRNISGRAELSITRSISGSKGGINKFKNSQSDKQSVASDKQSVASDKQSVASDKQSVASDKQSVAIKEKEIKEKEIKEKEKKGEKEKYSESKKENLSLTNNLGELEDYGEMFIGDQHWAEDRAEQMDCSKAVLYQYIKEFMKTNTKIGKKWTSLDDIRRHFIHWYELQPVFGNVKIKI